MNAILILENGIIFKCKSFTGSGEASGEIIFNTSTTGYQEILTDPSYSEQIIVMTYPIIGNYGINFLDLESDLIYPTAFLIKEYKQTTSNFRIKSDIAKFLKWHGVMGLEGLDTRELTKCIRNFGSMKAHISTLNSNCNYLTKKIKTNKRYKNLNIVKKISTNIFYRINDGKIKIFDNDIKKYNNFWKFKKTKKSILLYDYGVKLSILRYLLKYNFEIIVIPHKTSQDIIERINPNGIILSNGPGNPLRLKSEIKIIKKLISKNFPIFGICLGHQILSVAMGLATYRLKFGHRGGNHPVKNLITGKIETTVQNHSFAIDSRFTKQKNIEITHINLNDGTIEGLRHTKFPVFSIQYHPESSPGPNDSNYVFNQFRKLI